MKQPTLIEPLPISMPLLGSLSTHPPIHTYIHTYIIHTYMDRRELFVPRLGQSWPCLDPLPLLPLLFGIAFHLQLVLLSYHPIFLRLCHFLKRVSFLGATCNRTKSASVCLWLSRSAM